MISRALGANNDLILQNGSFLTVVDAAQVVQHVRTRLLFYTNEWFLDIQAGVPYFDRIFVKPADLADIESILKAQILQTPGVEILTEFSMEYNETTRALDVAFSALTEFGDITNQTVLINVSNPTAVTI